MKRAILGLLVTGLLAGPMSGQADVILSNLPGTGSGTGTNLGLGPDSTDRTKGVGLTMGATAMTFESLDALISNPSPASVLSGGIYSSLGGNPGSLLAAFTPVNIGENFGPSVVNLLVAGSFELAANTSYWFVLDGPGTVNLLLWQNLNPNTAPTATGVTYNGYLFSENGGASWGSSAIFNGVRINATPVGQVPEPGSLALLGLGLAGLGLSRRRKAS